MKIFHDEFINEYQRLLARLFGRKTIIAGGVAYEWRGDLWVWKISPDGEDRRES